jgi:hypothetical protein
MVMVVMAMMIMAVVMDEGKGGIPSCSLAKFPA